MGQTDVASLLYADDAIAFIFHPKPAWQSLTADNIS
jgi:hypothetical protein